MFEKIDTILTAVDAVEGIEYVSDIIADEITAYSAFVIDGDVDIDDLKELADYWLSGQ